MASISSAHPSSSFDWILKPAFGYGREERERIVEQFFNQTSKTILDHSNEIWEKVKRGDYKCRLLYPEKIDSAAPKGIVVMGRGVTDRFEKLGLPSCLEIQVLSPLNSHDQEIPALYEALVSKAKEEAHELKGHSILITLSKTQKTAAYLFENQGFRAVKNDERPGNISLGLNLPLNGNGSAGAKRGAEEAKTAIPEPKRRKITFPENRGEKRGSVEELERERKKGRTEMPAQREPERPLGITLKKVYIHHIRAGRKTIEGRVNSGMFRNLREGRLVRFFYFHDQTDDVICKVQWINRYSSFREMLEKEGYQACVPEAYSLEHAVEIYNSIPNYTENAAKFGVLAIKLELQR